MAVKLTGLAQVTVATAGTEQALSATATPVMSVTIQALPGNTGNIYVGDSAVDSTHGFVITPGSSIEITAPLMGRASEQLILSDIYVDAATNGDKVVYGYIKAR